MPQRRRQHELRCFCSRRPLLATYGIDRHNELFVHVKVYKQRRIYGEILITGGKVKLLCRECLRWYTVVIRQPGRAELQEFQVPNEIAGSPNGTPVLAPGDTNSIG